MKNFIIIVGVLSCLFLGSFALATRPLPVVNVSLTKAFLTKGVMIVDIRQNEARQKVGILPGSHLLTFEYEDTFLAQIQQLVDKDKTFALLSDTGVLSTKVAQFLASHGYKHVINLTGGMKVGLKNKIQLVGM